MVHQRANERTGRKRQVNEEGRALGGLAGHRYVAAHHLAEPPGDRQSEAGSAKLPRRRGIGLGEFLEQPGQLVRRHADPGVGDRKLDAFLSVVQ